MLAYKFRLYPNREQAEKLEFSLDMCRQAYNLLLEELNNQIVIDKSQIQAMLPDLKICEPRFREVYSKTLQYECYRLFSNLSALKVLKENHKKVGRLRFKGKGWFKTMNYNQSGFSLEGNHLDLSKIGNIKIKVHREVKGVIKQIQIKREVDKWYAIIITDANRELKCGNKVIGIDLGLNNYLVDSDENYVNHPKLIEKYSKQMKHLQQNLSRKKKGSNNRKKSKLLLIKLHNKIENSRNDFLHKLSTKYITKCKIIVVEDLKIKQMMMTFYNAKNMADASWGKFIQFLTYKAESAGCKIVKINPKNTTKICSKCGNIQDMPLWARTYKCSSCGLEIDRDYNSAINILKGGKALLGKELAYVENNSSAQIEQELSMKQEGISLNIKKC